MAGDPLVGKLRDGKAGEPQAFVKACVVEKIHDAILKRRQSLAERVRACSRQQKRQKRELLCSREQGIVRSNVERT